MKSMKNHRIFSRVALNALERIKNIEQSPIVAWNDAIKELKCCEKGCPKSTFLGLCEDGLIQYVKSGKYISKSKSKNKIYALEAVKILNIEQIQKNEINPRFLWEKLQTNINQTTQTRIKYNQQMDVVLALWDAGYIST